MVGRAALLAGYTSTSAPYMSALSFGMPNDTSTLRVVREIPGQVIGPGETKDNRFFVPLPTKDRLTRRLLLE
eukprot:8585036-Pyramimonas_sp.AAC.1